MRSQLSLRKGSLHAHDEHNNIRSKVYGYRKQSMIVSNSLVLHFLRFWASSMKPSSRIPYTLYRFKQCMSCQHIDMLHKCRKQVFAVVLLCSGLLFSGCAQHETVGRQDDFIANPPGVGEEADYGCSYFYFLWGRHAELAAKYDEALECHKKSLSIWEEVGNHQFIAKSYRFLGTHFLYKRDVETANDYLQNALDLFQTIRNNIDYEITLNLMPSRS